MMMRVVILALALIAAPSAAKRCPLPAALDAWTSTPAMTGSLVIGRTRSIPLDAAPRHASPPTKAGGPEARGAAIVLDVPPAGTYRVALGGTAWIDLVRDGKPLASTAHAHGDACTGIAKTGDFTLVPGRYTVQLSGAKQPMVKVLVARLP